MNNNDYDLYTPQIQGAKKLGPTQIYTVNNCGGYNQGANEYMAILPDGSKIDNTSIYGGLLGKNSFKKDIIKPWYEKHLKNDEN